MDPENVEEDEEELEPLIPEDPKGGGEGGEDEEMLSQPQMTREESEDVALRLRGGANTDSEEEEEEDEDYLDEDEVELGLLEPMPKNRDEWDIDYKVGKIGGLPIWLDPRAPLDASQVACEVCEKTMSLLLQVRTSSYSINHIDTADLVSRSFHRSTHRMIQDLTLQLDLSTFSLVVRKAASRRIRRRL